MRFTKSSFFLLPLFLTIAAFSQTTGINFETADNWSAIVKKASEQHKFIFVDCYATWCKPCRAMDQNVYNTRQAGDYFNKNFICVKVQMDSTGSDNKNVQNWYKDAGELKHKYMVNAFPTLLFFSPEGKIVHKGVGYQDSNGLIKLAGNATRPEEQYYTLLASYERNRTADFEAINKLVNLCNSVNDVALGHKIANEYINRLTSNQMLNKNNLRFTYYHTNFITDRGFSFFKDSAKLIHSVDSAMTPAICRGLLMPIIYAQEIKPFEESKNGRPDWKQIEANINKYGDLGKETYNIHYKPGIVFRAILKPEMERGISWPRTLTLIKRQRLGEGEKYLTGNALVYYENQLKLGKTKNCSNFVSAAKYYVTKYPELAKSSQLNEFAFTVFQYDNNKKDLNLALDWAKLAVDNADSKYPYRSEDIDTYANLLYKLGKKQEAIKWERKAMELNRSPQDSTYIKTLNKWGWKN